MKAQRRMTGVEFDAIRPLLNISEDRIKAARMALVDGQTMQGIANVFGWTRQAVFAAVNVVWRAAERYHESQRAANSAGTLLPPGWEQVTLIAPSSLIAKFRAEIALASQQPATEPAKKAATKRPAKTK